MHVKSRNLESLKILGYLNDYVVINCPLEHTCNKACVCLFSNDCQPRSPTLLLSAGSFLFCFVLEDQTEEAYLTWGVSLLYKPVL